jgi:hypothetical protein
VRLLVPRDGMTRTKPKLIFANLALPEVSTTVYNKHQITSGQSSLSSTMAFGRWISTTKIDKKNLVTSIFSLCSNRFIRPVSLQLLASPSGNCNCHGHHGHGGAIFKKIREKATRKQSQVIIVFVH